MNKTRVIFFFALLAIVIAIARHNSPSAGQTETKPGASTAPASGSPATLVATSPAPAQNSSPIVQETPAVQPSATPSVALQKVIRKVAPAVASISVFDAAGKLLRTGSGCFVSHDGRVVTSASMIQGAAHGVAKTSDGRILNVTGILAESAALDLAVLKAETQKGVEYLSADKSPSIEAGTQVAVVGSPLRRGQPGHIEGTISAKHSDQSGDWLELGKTIPKEFIGSPIVGEKGELIGLVTAQQPQGGSANMARKAEAVESVLHAIKPDAPVAWQVAENSPNETAEPPAEGPSATPTPSPSRFAKIPVVQADRAGNTKLIYSPKPRYPTAARHSYFPLRGTGRYRVTFGADGRAQNVSVLESSRSETLDNAAVDALRKWKAAPGTEWSATVPITFQP